jgi:hypothetical protein
VICAEYFFVHELEIDCFHSFHLLLSVSELVVRTEIISQVALNGRLVGQRPLPKSSILVIPEAVMTGNGGASLRFNDYWTQTAFSGYFKNLALFRRALSLSEVCAMSSLPLPQANLERLSTNDAKMLTNKEERRTSEKVLAIATAEKTAAAVAQAAAGPAVYGMLVRQSAPIGFWPMGELRDNGECADHSNEDPLLQEHMDSVAIAAAADAAEIRLVKPGNLVHGRIRGAPAISSIIRSLVCETRHRGGLLMGETGPMTGPGRPGFRGVLFQGGSVRSADGLLCDFVGESRETALKESAGAQSSAQRNVKSKEPAITLLKDFTFEMWIRRTDPAAEGMGSGPRIGIGEESNMRQDTLLSIGSDSRPLPGSAWWRFTSDEGRLDFAIEGEKRPVGPCPSASNGGRELRDLNWHHVAVSRTANPKEVYLCRFRIFIHLDVFLLYCFLQVNNWAFYVDGERIWTTRHDGVPVVHPTSSILVGRRHGENWPAAAGRDWRPGASDRTCLRGQACMLAIYRYALPPATLRAHYQAVVRMTSAAAAAAAAAAAVSSPSNGFSANVLPAISKNYFGPHSKPQPSLPDGISNANTSGKDDLLVKNSGQISRVDFGDSSNTHLKSAGQEPMIVQRSRASAAQHVPLVWGRSPKPATTDLSSFYASLENNPVWRLTRRVQTQLSLESARLEPTRPGDSFSISSDLLSKSTSVSTASAGMNSDWTVHDYDCEDGDVPLSNAPSDPASRTELDGAHGRAADALQLVADPGGRGLWERTTLHTLSALPHHLACAGRWTRLTTVFGAPSFLGQMILELGSTRTKAILASAVMAASAAIRAGSGESAAVARDQLALLWELVNTHIQAEKTDCGCEKLAEMWEHGLKSGLPGIERAAHVLREIRADCTRLMVQDSTTSMPGSESRRIELEQAVLRLRTASRTGMDILVGGGGNLDAAISEIETHLNECADSDVGEYPASGEVRYGTQSCAILDYIMNRESDDRGAAVGGAAAFGGQWATGKDSAATKSVMAAEYLALLFCFIQRTREANSARSTVRVRLRGPYPSENHACEALRARLLCRTRPAASDSSFSVYLVRIEPWFLERAMNTDRDDDWEILAVFSCWYAPMKSQIVSRFL